MAASSPAAVEGTQEPLLQGFHILPPAKGSYNTDPPTSGEHYGAPYAPIPWGFTATVNPPEVWLHNAEHGGIVVLYRDPADLDTVRQFIANAPPDPEFGEVKIIDSQYPLSGHRFALVSWGWLEFMDTWDSAAATRFYEAHVDRGTETVP